MVIQNPVPLHKVTAVADLRVTKNPVVDHLLTQNHVPDRCLVHPAAMTANTRVVQDILTLDRVLGLDHILEIVDVVTVAILEALVRDVADM